MSDDRTLTDDTESLHNRAGLLWAQGKYSEAEPLYRRVLKIRGERFGPNHLEVATSLNNLALVLKVQEEYADAERLYLRALKICKDKLGTDHPNTIMKKENRDKMFGLKE